MNFLVIGTLIAALVLAFVAYAYREFGADNKALDEVAKRTQLQRAARSGAQVQVPEELSQLLSFVDLGKSRPSAHVYDCWSGPTIKVRSICFVMYGTRGRRG
jgi:hypothetical protein